MFPRRRDQKRVGIHRRVSLNAAAGAVCKPLEFGPEFHFKLEQRGTMALLQSCVVLIVAGLSGFAVSGCGSKTNGNDTAVGGATGGSSHSESTDGSGAGGANNTGGALGSGGANNTGGAIASGGSSGSSGGSGGGGSSSGGSSSGSVPGTGGTTSVGGTSNSGTSGTAVFCTVNGKQVPEGLAYYNKCNGCYCQQGGVWCTGVSCPTAGSTLYSCPDGLTKVTYGNIGGMGLYHESSVMDPTAWTYTHARVYDASTNPSLSCTVAMPICYSMSGIVLNDLKTDFAAAEVSAAFAASTPPLYGLDTRPVDGAVFSITRSDGHGVLVGSACPTPASASCVPIPDAVQKLADDLRYLDREMLQMQSPPLADCAVFTN